VLLIDGIVKCNGPFSKFPVNKVFWIFQCQMSQSLLYRQVCYAISLLRYFALNWLETVHHFLHLRDNFQLNVIWHRQSMGTHVFCRRLAESDVTFMPSVMCMDGLRWWYNHVVHLVCSSVALVFLTNMNEKCKSTSPSAIQMKIWWKTIVMKGK